MEETNGTEKMSELEQKVIRQVEYYFGDVNLGRDKFMKQEIKRDEGWISLELLLKFNRLRQLSEDEDVIVKALKKSSSGLLEINEEDKKVRRSPDKPIPELTAERRDDLKGRSLYIKGFPLDSTLDTLQTFLEKHGKTENIFMRRDGEKNFKGSIFVLYETKEMAEKVLGEESLKYGENELVRLYKDEYFKKKLDERKQRKEQDIQEKEESKKKREEEEKEKLLQRITQGAILYVKGVPEGLSREDLRSIFGETVKVAWVDFEIGDTEAKLRFDEEGGAKKTLEAMEAAGEGKVKVKDTEVEAKVLEGEEELDHWQRLFHRQWEKKDKRKRKMGGGRGHRGPHGRGGPQAKKQKFEDDDGGDSDGSGD